MKNYQALNYITLASLGALLGIIVFYLFWPHNPLEIKSPVKTLTEEVDAGEVVFVEFNFKKNTEVRPDISLSIVDGVIFNIPEYSPINPVGETEGKVVGITIPASVPCGEYHLEWVARYHMNPLRTVEVPYESEPFRVNSKICGE